MGTWGPGNFENDCAADHLFEVCGPLLEQIKEAMQSPDAIEPGEYDSDIVVANLEIIACLSEHLGKFEEGPIQDFLYPCVLPEPELIADWKKMYLAVWDESIEGLAPDPDYKKQRREVIIDTFNRVERLAQQSRG